MTRFHVVMTGRDCEPWAHNAVRSVLTQQNVDVRVTVVDDGSTDNTAAEIKQAVDGDGRVTVIRHDRSVGAMASQWEAWHQPGNTPDTVVAWVDLDDRLAHDHALERVEREYRRGCRVVYGSYEPDPPSATCPPVQPYPATVVAHAGFRAFIAARGGIRHNHLRTVAWPVLEQVTEQDCRDDNGDWWMAAPDFAVMIPALEIAAPNIGFIPDVLYRYTSDRTDAEWRVIPTEVNRVHQAIIHRPPRKPLSRAALRAMERAAVDARRRRR